MFFISALFAYWYMRPNTAYINEDLDMKTWQAFDDVHHVPTYDVISHLVYVSDEQDVASVVVDGKVLMNERSMLTIDTDRVRAEATALAAKIQAALRERNEEQEGDWAFM